MPSSEAPSAEAIAADATDEVPDAAGFDLSGQDRGAALADIRRPLERLGPLLSTLAILVLLAYAAAVVVVKTSGLGDGQSILVDFVAFWAAAKLMVAGTPAAAFDQAVLLGAQALPDGDYLGQMYWLYPAAWQILVAPFGLLPFWAALLLFDGISLGAFLASIRRWAHTVPMGRNLVIFAPAVVVTVIIGQISLLWAAGLVASLWAIASGRPAVAGLFLALLTVKPQLGVLVLVALVAARLWRVIGWASLFAVLLHGVSTLIVGVEYWRLFFARASEVAAATEHGKFPLELMVSPYAFLRFLGFSHGPALTGQVLMTLALAAGVAWLWTRRSGVSGLAAGGLFVAIPLATPYAFYYGLTYAVPGAIFLVRGGFGARAFDRVLLGLATLGPVVLFVRTETAPMFAPVLALLFLRAVLFARGSRDPAGAVRTAPVP